MIGKFEITLSPRQTYMFNLRADNGLVILSSPVHATKASVLEGIEQVRRHAAIASSFERLVSAHEEPYFNVRSTEGALLAHSQMYSSISAMENGMASVARNGPNAVLVDMAPDHRSATTR